VNHIDKLHPIKKTNTHKRNR